MDNTSKQGWLRVVGLGPGDPGGTDPGWITQDAAQVLYQASDCVGYQTYLDRLMPKQGQTLHASENRVELERARFALELAESGKKVAVISGGDPGIFAMAAAVMEAIEFGKPEWRSLDVAVCPGISAFQAVSARLGAMMGGDFAVISLSDNLKPRDVIARRLKVVVEAGLVAALYNPASKARPDFLLSLASMLSACLPAQTPVVFARAIGGAGEKITITTLEAADFSLVDMRTLVLIGSAETRIIERAGSPPFVYTARSVGVLPR
jgi:precorrin-3B C17-methyltransferase